MASEITAFYNSTNVLITGGTGLLGQLLLEKLLRTCSDITGIYLILRGKKGKSGHERLLEASNGPVFDTLRAVNPEFIRKIHVVEGDCSKLQLGLDDASQKLLLNKINVVFHCAASLNMDAKLQDAVYTNIRGLDELLGLCRQMPNLKSFVFVSTAYSNCIHSVIEEKFYEAPLKPDTIIKLTQEVDSRILESLTPKLLDRWPNTYCYTKAIAEETIRKNAVDLPIALFRPSIIMPTYAEPVPGWTCNIYGPTGLFIAVGLGVLRITYGHVDKKIDLVPADFCANALICTAWETHMNFKRTVQQVQIYNYAGGENRNITVKLMTEYARRYKYPISQAIWALSHRFTSSRVYYNIMQILLHYIPAYLADASLFLIGQKPRMIKAYEKLSKISDVLSIFITQEWAILNDNVYRLWDRLNETDKTLFPFDMDVIDYQEFLIKSTTGLKVYILKESLENVEKDEKRRQRLEMLHASLKVVLLIVLILLISKVFSVVFQ